MLVVAGRSTSPRLSPTRLTIHLLPPVENADGPVYFVKWREPGGLHLKKRVGPAWVEGGEAAPGDRRATRHVGWIKRWGRPPSGYFTEDTALASVAMLVEQAREKRARATRGPDQALTVTFDEVAAAWLEHRRTVGGCKRSTLTDCGDAAPGRREEPQARPSAEGEDHGRVRRANRGVDHHPRALTLARPARSRPVALATRGQRAPRRDAQRVRLRMPRGHVRATRQPASMWARSRCCRWDRRFRFCRHLEDETAHPSAAW